MRALSPASSPVPSAPTGESIPAVTGLSSSRSSHSAAPVSSRSSGGDSAPRQLFRTLKRALRSEVSNQIADVGEALVAHRENPTDSSRQAILRGYAELLSKAPAATVDASDGHATVERTPTDRQAFDERMNKAGLTHEAMEALRKASYEI